jgi:hypothetical protein
VRDRDGSRAAVVEQRLDVRPRVGAGRRVARVPDREVSSEPRQVPLVEHLRHEAEVAERRQPPFVRDRDSRRLLAAML